MRRYFQSSVLIFAVVLIFLSTQVAAGTIKPDSVALGDGCTASGDHSTAIGWGSTASSMASTAIGYQTTASSSFSTAMGYRTKALGSFSTAIGVETESIGGLSIAIGYNVSAEAESAIVMGKGFSDDYYLKNLIPNSFMVGYMSSSTDTAPEFFVKDGAVGVGTKVPDALLEIAGTQRHKTLRVSESPGGLDVGRVEIGYDSSGDFGRVFVWDGAAGTPADLVLGGANVGIGTDNPQYELDVIGDTRVTGNIYYGGSSGGVGAAAYNKPDYVFEDGYKVLSTDQVAKHLEKEKSLPWITSLKQEQEENGAMVDMTRMSFETVETVENLQVQIIALSKIIKEQQKLIESEQNAVKRLETEVVALRTLVSN